MSLARTGTIFVQELAHTFKRPLFWFLVVMLTLMTWGLSTGDMQIQSGELECDCGWSVIAYPPNLGMIAESHIDECPA